MLRAGSLLGGLLPGAALAQARLSNEADAPIALPPLAPFTAAGATQPIGLAARFDNLRTPYDFGARGVVGGTPTDDTAALNAAFRKLGNEGGGRLYIPGTFHAAGALSTAPNVEICGDFTPTSQQYTPAVSYFSVGGSKLILGSGITLAKGNILRNCMVIASDLPSANPATAAAAASLVARMARNGTGITLAGDNCLLDNLQVLGFDHGIRGEGDPAVDRQVLRNIHADNINSIWLAAGGDTCHIIGAHLWPYLTVTAPGPTAGYRSGYGIYTSSNGGSIQIAQVTSLGYQVDFMTESNSVTYVQCWADGGGANASGDIVGQTGFGVAGTCGSIQLIHCTSVTNQYGVRHAPSNGAVLNIGPGCVFGAGGPGGAGALQSFGILADGHGPVVSIGAIYNGGDAAVNLGPDSGPSIFIGNTFDDAASNFDHVWRVHPAVLPLVTKFGNRVVNSPRGLTEQTLGTPAMGGAAFHDQMPNQISLGPRHGTTAQRPRTGTPWMAYGDDTLSVMVFARVDNAGVVTGWVNAVGKPA